MISLSVVFEELLLCMWI